MIGRNDTNRNELESGTRSANSLMVIAIFAFGFLLCWLFVQSLRSKYQTNWTASEVINPP